MKSKRFAVEQITSILKQGELGVPISELCCKFGISEQSYYRWKKQYGGMEAPEARALKALREENARLKGLVADRTLDKVMLQDVCKKILRAAHKREMVEYLTRRYAVSKQRACRCVRLMRSVYYYRSDRDPQLALRNRIHELAAARVRFGYRRILMLLNREGWRVGKKRAYRIYREEGLVLRRKRPWRQMPATEESCM